MLEGVSLLTDAVIEMNLHARMEVRPGFEFFAYNGRIETRFFAKNLRIGSEVDGGSVFTDLADRLEFARGASARKLLHALCIPQDPHFE